MYCSKRYADAAADIMEIVLNNEHWHCDYAVSLIHKNFNIYAPKIPYFVQSDYWTFPWTSVGLDEFDIKNTFYKGKKNDPVLNP
jgi:hypothetical protein